MARNDLKKKAITVTEINASAGPMVGFVRADSLHAFSEKRKMEKSGAAALSAIRKQRMAMLQQVGATLQKEKNKESELKAKMSLVRGPRALVIAEDENEDEDSDTRRSFDEALEQDEEDLAVQTVESGAVEEMAEDWEAEYHSESDKQADPSK